jgi:transposase
MAKLEIFQNGNFSNGDPVYQIGSKNADGEYDISVFELMTEAEAKTKLKSMGGSPAKKAAPEKKAAPKKKEVVEEVEETSKADLNQMTKLQLEEFAREFGVELDRREKKASLVKDAYKAQFDG